MADINKFQMTRAQSWAGMTLKNNLAAIYGTQPQFASKVVTRLLAESGMQNLETVLNQFPTLYLDSDDDFVWKLIGSSERNIPLVEARYKGATVITSDTGVGANGESFELVFEEKWFSDVNVIVGEKNEIYQLRIISDPVPEGDTWVYEVELMNANIIGMPGSELIGGKRFSKEFSPVESELSIKGGDITFTSPITMRNEFTTLRLEHKAPGSAMNVRLVADIETLGPDGTKHTSSTWMQEVHWKFEQEVTKEKAKALYFARSNRDAEGRYYNVGKSGVVIKQGAGIREQMELSNTRFYNSFSIDLLTNMLMELSEGKIALNDRKFLLRTGERGAVQFHKAVTDLASGWTSLTTQNPAVYQKASSPLHANAFKAGFQFTEWFAPNGIHVMLEIDPMYDDKVRNKILHPNGGVAESYRYDILYLGSSEEPNIQKVMVKGSEEFRGYKAGFRNPFTGERDINYMGHMEDSAVMTAYCQLGAKVTDSSRTASLIPSILA